MSIVYKKPAVAFSREIIVDCCNSKTIPGPQFAFDNGCFMGDAADAIQFMTKFTIPLVRMNSKNIPRSSVAPSNDLLLSKTTCLWIFSG